MGTTHQAHGKNLAYRADRRRNRRLLQDLKRIVLMRGLTVDWDNLQPRDQAGVMECSAEEGVQAATDRAVSLANQTQWREAAE
jgi:hypothetical protein